MSFDANALLSIRALDVYAREKAHSNPAIFLKINDSKALEVSHIKGAEVSNDSLMPLIAEIAIEVFERFSTVSSDLLRDREGRFIKESVHLITEPGKVFTQILSHALSYKMNAELIEDSNSQIDSLVDLVNSRHSRSLNLFNEDVFSQIISFISSKDISEIRSTSKLFDKAMVAKREAIAFKALPTVEQLVNLARYTNLKTIDFSPIGDLVDDDIFEVLLPHLKGIKGLKKISFESCKAITDRTLARLSTFNELKSVDLSGCFRLLDASLQHLHPLVKLKELNLSAGYGYSDALFRYLSPFENLEVLNLSYNPEITDEGLRNLAAFGHLKTLILEECSITDRGLGAIASLSGLKHLSLYQCSSITNEGVLRISALKNLEVLDLSLTLRSGKFFT